MADVTQILFQIESGDTSAADQLLPLVYEELRRLAAARLTTEKPGRTLQATALVHEAYLRIVDVDKAQQWNSRGHFFGAAAEAMRRILIEEARRKDRQKHGGGLRRVELFDAANVEEGRALELIALDEALTKFAEMYPVKAELVKLRFFAGLTIDEAASMLQISRNTAKRYWSFARAWLEAEISDSDGPKKNPN